MKCHVKNKYSFVSKEENVSRWSLDNLCSDKIFLCKENTIFETNVYKILNIINNVQ